MTNTLALMASKRRLFVVPQMIVALRALIADKKGEVTADVVSAKALTKAQSDKLAKTLKASVGSDVIINASVDESLIGGLVVKVGSKMIDTSVNPSVTVLPAYTDLITFKPAKWSNSQVEFRAWR